MKYENENIPIVFENIDYENQRQKVDLNVIKKDKEYRRMLNFLCGYTMVGKNRNDDVPDAWSLFAEYVQQLEGNKVEVFKRPF